MDFESPDWQASIILRTRVGSGCSESISMYGSRDVGLLRLRLPVITVYCTLLCVVVVGVAGGIETWIRNLKSDCAKIQKRCRLLGRR